jgi:hypothetical protein
MATVWIYADTNKQVGDPEHIKVFANADAAEAWFAENDSMPPPVTGPFFYSEAVCFLDSSAT